MSQQRVPDGYLFIPLAAAIEQSLVAALTAAWRKAYDESEHPRDDHGRWTDASGGTDLTVEDGTYKVNWSKAGTHVDGLEVSDDISNMDSISASLGNDYEILDDVREVPMSAFEDSGPPSFYSQTESKRVHELAEEIKASGQIEPLIVVLEEHNLKAGPYVLEGGHRFDALKILGKKKFPALVVIDTEQKKKAYDESQHPRDEHGRWTDAGSNEPSPVSPIPIEQGPGGSTASTQFMAEIENTMSAVPNTVQKKMADAGVKVKTGIMITDLYPELKGVHPRGWPAGMTWDHVEALHSPKDRAIVVTEMKKLVGGKMTPNTRVKGALLHEAGHAWDQTLDKPSSFSPTFVDAYNDDKQQLTKEERGKLRYYLQKGQAGRSEAFAELFAQHVGKGAASFDIREFFPNASRWVKYSMDMGGVWKPVGA